MKKKIKYLLSFSPLNLYETIRDKVNQVNQLKKQIIIIDCYLKDNETKKLHIGCGTNILEGWLNTDLKHNDEVLYLDAAAQFPFLSESFDFVYSEHLFEHLKVEQQLNMLSESYRILKEGGIMRIATPDLAFLFKIYDKPTKMETSEYVDWAVKNIHHLKAINNSIVDKDEHYVYVINNFFKAWGHQVIHNSSSLTKLALQCKFRNVRECKVGESEVLALQNIEKHGTIIPKRINLFESMVIEIMK